MPRADMTTTVEITFRPLWQRLLRVPMIFGRHYRAARRDGTSRLVSIYVSWVMLGVVLKWKTGPA